ncbi:unnamed protein product [Symbiodinium sp. CCMP2456]|nr:unnamed protein product [Symbiodinium sp. CCMP2456]
MSLVDSTAAFKQRCHDVDGGALQTALEAQGITSFASLAYACGTPQDRPTQAEMDAFDQKRRLVGVHIERDMIPSHALVDLCCHMLDVGADREAWLIMASEVKSIKVTAAGDFPLGLALDALRTDPRITMYLMATWGRAPDVKPVDVDHPPPAHNKPGEGLSRSAKRRRRLKAAAASRTTTPTGKAPSAARTMPAELKDAHQKAEDGTPICWDHNCGGCKNKTEGVQRCGYLLPVNQGPQLLPSERLHATCDWRGTSTAVDFARLVFVYPAAIAMVMHVLPPSSTATATRSPPRVVKPPPHPLGHDIRYGWGSLFYFYGYDQPASAQSRFPIQPLDLTVDDDLAMLLDIIRLESANIAWIHCANSLYRAVGAIADLALELRIFISIENPANSLAWLCDGLDHLFRCPHHEVVFDACMHGGTRDKRALLWCSDDRFLPLALLCSRDHAHDEAAYPHLLCERMAYIVADLAELIVVGIPREPQDFVNEAVKDDQLWADLRDGFRLTGWMRDTGIFDKKLRPPETTLERLLEQSSYRTPLILNKLRKTVVDDTTRKAWAETLEEEKKGWIFREAMATDKPMVIAHRFGLEQKGKVRVIDNGKECGLNLACGLPEKFTLHGVDVLAGVFVELLNRPLARGLRIKGRTIDLVSAYKFYPIHPEDRRHLRIGVFDTDSNVVRLYGTNVLPFGATGSVAGFLRVSAALWHTGVRDMGLGWCAYFDDFPLLAVEGHEAQVDRLAGEVFDALDVEYAKEGKKATSFGETFNALGLSFDLTRFHAGVVTLRHTEARTAELLETLDEILQERRLRPKDAEVLRGRMHWYTSYLFGRAPCEAMHQISLRAQGHDACVSLTKELEEALVTMRFFLSDPKPLEIRQTTGREMFVFTDGSYEPNGDVKAGIGGVLYDDTGTPLAFFSSDVSASDLSILEDQSDHPIYEVELYAAVVAFELWGHLIQDSFTVFFLDNEAAQSALIAGKSGTSNGRVLVQRFLDAEHRWRARPWIGRVPTYSNPADDPSRRICEPLIKQGARQMDVSGVRLLSQ